MNPKSAALWMWFVANWTVSAFVTPQKEAIHARLVGGLYLHTGRVEVNIAGEWGPVCGDQWQLKDADVLCQQLGFPRAVSVSVSSKAEGSIVFDKVKCNGGESNLGECTHTHPRDCDNTNVAVECQKAPLPVHHLGGVHILYDGRWLPVCQGTRGVAMAEVVCRQLGYQYILSIGGQQHMDSDIEASAGSQLHLDFDCSGHEEYLALCQTSGPSVEQCNVTYEVTCSDQMSAHAGEIIRLFPEVVGGTRHLEVNFRGEWWSICREGLDLTAAQLACRQLGFQHVLSLYAKYVPKSPSEQQDLFGIIQCKGIERTLQECEYYLDKTYTCASHSLAGVTCSDNKATSIPDYQIRLVGGTFPYEGRVEVSYNGLWGTVCDDHWGYMDADVVCRQLGFYAAEAVASSAYFGEGSGPIFLDDVTCLGNETSIVYCSHSGIGQHNCNHNEDAGVRCYENETQLLTLAPSKQDSILPVIVILINGLIALLILVGCAIYCSLKIWDRYTGHTQRAQLRRMQDASTEGGTQDNNIPMEYTEDPPPYHTVHENRDVYITQRSETPPPEYSEVMKLQEGTQV